MIQQYKCACISENGVRVVNAFEKDDNGPAFMVEDVLAALAEKDKIIAERDKEIERLRLKLEVQDSINRSLAHPVPSPCGHSSQYAYTEDNGRHIRCLLCVEVNRNKEIERLKAEMLTMEPIVFRG